MKKKKKQDILNILQNNNLYFCVGRRKIGIIVCIIQQITHIRGEFARKRPRKQ
jgi:hypothetical protein